MLVSVDFNSFTYDLDGHTGYRYTVKDTTFDADKVITTRVTFEANAASRRLYWYSVEALLALIKAYEKPNPKELARWYLQCSRRSDLFSRYGVLSTWFKTDCEWLDKFFPEIEYSTKLYPCVLSQFEMLQYPTGRHIIPQS